MSKKSKIITSVIVLIVVAGGAFWFGMNYGKSQTVATGPKAGVGFTGRIGRNGAGAGFISGTIISADSSTITLQLPSSTGGSKIILYSPATQISKTISGTSADLTVGASVNITGVTNSDGSVTANSIQIRPAQ